MEAEAVAPVIESGPDSTRRIVVREQAGRDVSDIRGLSARGVGQCGAGATGHDDLRAAATPGTMADLRAPVVNMGLEEIQKQAKAS